MTLTLSKVKEVPKEEIQRLMLPTIKKIYKNVEFLGITEEEFLYLTLRIIEESKKNYNGKEPYETYITIAINNAISYIIGEALKNPESAYILICNHIKA